MICSGIGGTLLGPKATISISVILTLNGKNSFIITPLSTFSSIETCEKSERSSDFNNVVDLLNIAIEAIKLLRLLEQPFDL